MNCKYCLKRGGHTLWATRYSYPSYALYWGSAYEILGVTVHFHNGSVSLELYGSKSV